MNVIKSKEDIIKSEEYAENVLMDVLIVKMIMNAYIV